MKVFTGFDPRESEGWKRFALSLVETSTNWVLYPPMCGKQGDGSTAFAYARFEIPDVCGWSDPALFVDGVDMMLLSDISGLAKLYEPSYAVQVVKHDYKTKHPRKFIGTEMECDNADYPRKNWSSVILWNCGHRSHWRNREEIRKAIDEGNGRFLHRFGWLKDEEIGDLPHEWNWLVDEYGENPKAKLLHWTAGAPFLKHYKYAPMANHWHEMETVHSER